MSSRRPDPVRVLLVVGFVAFALAGLSIADMFLPRPYDGVLLESDDLGGMRVRKVVPGSGADLAGVDAGDRIVGIARNVLRSPDHAAALLAGHRIGDVVPYLIRGDSGFEEVGVRLGPRRAGDPYYGFACLLGFAFFGVGLFVLLRQPRRLPSQVFFLVAVLFMLFLICRLRPASYTWVDRFVLSTGTAALLFLPATFLHFFLIFPRPIWKGRMAGRRWPSPSRRALGAALAAIYLVPPAVLVSTLLLHRGSAEGLRLISGAPVANWWVLAVYVLLGLAALAYQAVSLPERRERRGAGLVFFGALFGLVPFLVTAVAFPTWLHTEKLLVYGVMPLALVPATFAYAIVRFQLLDIRVLLRKSLLYTLTTAVITVLYAAAIATAGALFSGTELAMSPYAPIILALAIVLLFEPLRRRLQVPLDRFFFAERERLRQAAREMGEAFAARPDLEGVVRDLVDRLPQLLNLRFAALYLARGDGFERAAGPGELPARLPAVPGLAGELERSGGLARTDRLGRVELRSREASRRLRRLAEAGVELIGRLASPRSEIGLVLLSGKTGQMAFEEEELELLRGLLRQASLALENSLLLEEKTRQAELERELEIAASIQRSLLPRSLSLSPGWQVAAVCRPARHVGGDFIVELGGPRDGVNAVALGDVAGKSVSGALVMMAAYEILSSLAMTARRPEELLRLANARLRRLGAKSFVALAYFVPSDDGEGLGYMLAGQPQPLKRGGCGAVEELALPEHRLPLGALATGDYRLHHAPVAPGEVLLGYSDGVLEARSPEGEFFGVERLRRVLGDSSAEAGEVVRDVLSAVERFTGGAEPYDDLTLLAVARRREVA